jgi:hypothetical protein
MLVDANVLKELEDAERRLEIAVHYGIAHEKPSYNSDVRSKDSSAQKHDSY